MQTIFPSTRRPSGVRAVWRYRSSRGVPLSPRTARLLVWDTGGAASRSRVTALVPVTASADDLELLTTGAEPPTDAALADLRKRIASLLSLAGDGVVLAVDPALLDALGVNEDTLVRRQTVARALGRPLGSRRGEPCGDVVLDALGSCDGPLAHRAVRTAHAVCTVYAIRHGLPDRPRFTTRKRHFPVRP